MNPRREKPLKPDQDIPTSSSIVPIHLLLVEDNPGDVRLVHEMLRDQAHIKLEVADCLAACMLRLDRGGIDLVLLDLGLRDSQGLDTLTSVAHIHPALPVVALTVLDDDELALRMVQAGGQDYLTKNTVTPEILRRTIRHAFERKQIELQKKEALEALRKSEENFRRSLEDSPLGVRIVTAKGETIYVNKAILEIYGYESIEEFKGIPIKERYTPQSYAEFQLRKKARDQGDFGPSEYEINIIRKNGEICHLLVLRKEVLWNGTKQFQIIYQDITERKRTEEALQTAFKENRNLLGELQHRAKNSFAMILGMISLALNAGVSPETKAALEDLGSRVRSISELYSLLYSAGSFNLVRLDEYCARIAAPLVGLSGNITLNTEMENITVSVKEAAPIGLILTELMTNAVKYAFPGGRRGTITIALKKTATGALLEVRDDGVGLPAGFDFSGSTGMGFNLVRALSGQINGSFRMEGGAAGTRCIVEFAAANNGSQ